MCKSAAGIHVAGSMAALRLSLEEAPFFVA